MDASSAIEVRGRASWTRTRRAVGRATSFVTPDITEVRHAPDETDGPEKRTVQLRQRWSRVASNRESGICSRTGRNPLLANPRPRPWPRAYAIVRFLHAAVSALHPATHEPGLAMVRRQSGADPRRDRGPRFPRLGGLAPGAARHASRYGSESPVRRPRHCTTPQGQHSGRSRRRLLLRGIAGETPRLPLNPLRIEAEGAVSGT
jgi:hypothetical protein